MSEDRTGVLSRGQRRPEPEGPCGPSIPYPFPGSVGPFGLFSGTLTLGTRADDKVRRLLVVFKQWLHSSS